MVYLIILHLVRSLILISNKRYDPFFLALKAPAAFHEKIRSLERARVSRHLPSSRHSSTISST